MQNKKGVVDVHPIHTTLGFAFWIWCICDLSAWQSLEPPENQNISPKKLTERTKFFPNVPHFWLSSSLFLPCHHFLVEDIVDTDFCSFTKSGDFTQLSAFPHGMEPWLFSRWDNHIPWGDVISDKNEPLQEEIHLWRTQEDFLGGFLSWPKPEL